MDDSEHLQALRRRFDAGEVGDFLFFWGHRPGAHGVTASCLSQWYAAPFSLDGQRYATAEHYMMAEKAALFGDREAKDRVLQAGSPGAAKALGREVRGFDEVVWRQHRFSIVVRANEAKFGQNDALSAFLRATGQKVLVEASPLDVVWGIGLSRDDAAAGDPHQWRGLNLLGFALMEVRRGL